MNFFGRLSLLLLTTLTAVSGDAPAQRQLDMQQQLNDLKATVKAHGDLNAMGTALAPFRKEVREKVVSKKKQRYIDVNGQEFQRGITAGGLAPFWNTVTSDPEESSSFDAMVGFSNKLKELGVDLIVVPVPSKFELYHDVFETEIPKGLPASPARTAMMIKLLEAGVEVFDVLPTLEAIKPTAEMSLYEVRGHHLSSYGGKHAGEALAKRLERYDLKGRDKSRFSIKERKSVERTNPKQPMTAFEVQLDGETYKHANDGEVVVVGDSQAFAHFTASWASHLARAAGVPITDLSLSSGGSWAVTRAAKLGAERLRNTKAVVLIVTSSAFSRPGWATPEIPKTMSISGLVSMGLYEKAFALVKANQGNMEAIGLDENYLNEAAYRMIATSEFVEADNAFKLLVTAYPNSANAHDS